jgi:hypothetical protein
VTDIQPDRNANTDDFLAHFGVKGMKWGVRHPVGPDGRVTGGGGSRKRFDTLADIRARSKAKNRQFDTLGDIVAKEKAKINFQPPKTKNRQFDTFKDIAAKEKSKIKFDSVRDILAKEPGFANARGVPGTNKMRQRLEQDHQKSIERGAETLRAANAFNSPSLAIGMKAVGLLMSAVSVGVAIKQLRNPSSANLSKIKTGFIAAGAIMTGIQALSIGRDINDIRNYSKVLKPGEKLTYDYAPRFSNRERQLTRSANQEYQRRRSGG